MSLLFAEKGCKVYYFDISEYNMKAAEKMVKDVNEETRVFRQHSYQQLCEEIYSANHPRIIIFSIPHGNPGDECVKALRPYMTKGDIILDCSNEFYGNTERRQADLAKMSARAGPSMSPGGDPQALEVIMPLLRRVAAKDHDGKPCTSPVGPGGSGHYVKMIHNGIEQGLMSVISEVWHILTKGFQLSYEEAAAVFEEWNQTTELYNTFLIYIAVDINRTKDEKGRYVLGRVQDKVVQDVDNTEGTGTWSCEEASQRAADAEASGRWQPSAMKVASRDDFIEDPSSKGDREWHINYQDLLHVWSAGSIIQAGGIMDFLHKVYSELPSKTNLLSNSQLGKQLTSLLPSMKRCILTALEAGMVIPAMSQSLEYYKYSTSVDLPTQLTEAELDYFGNHKFDLKEEHRGEPSKGKHHFEWKPAKGESDKSRL
ncbi:6-phosphogluconate dehydrogenase [Fusarium phyllophilum]|uniref:phosphogluconate dehydrogenase (NADP(+)-dependent, decarboxylating) n=1 Tax=Fusarium phyllophilum TaxID=47803 RepID=A0A8H5MTD8_9HYPO|nr:6-phosphogluconate dehydrogenase [Fusarium phyllophilum]